VPPPDPAAATSYYPEASAYGGYPPQAYPDGSGSAPPSHPGYHVPDQAAASYNANPAYGQQQQQQQQVPIGDETSAWDPSSYYGNVNGGAGGFNWWEQ
jgi:hypothetical protein